MASNRRLILSVHRRGGEDRDATLEAHARKVLAKMVSTRLLNTLRITIKCRANINKNNLGECHWRDLTKSLTAKSKHYTIILRRDLPLAQMLRTLTHELKHVEQMARGRLTYRRTYGTRGLFWRPGAGAGVKYELDETGDVALPWALRPWEIEARAAEVEFHGPRPVPCLSR